MECESADDDRQCEKSVEETRQGEITLDWDWDGFDTFIRDLGVMLHVNYRPLVRLVNLGRVVFVFMHTVLVFVQQYLRARPRVVSYAESVVGGWG